MKYCGSHGVIYAFTFSQVIVLLVFVVITGSASTVIHKRRSKQYGYRKKEIRYMFFFFKK